MELYGITTVRHAGAGELQQLCFLVDRTMGISVLVIIATIAVMILVMAGLADRAEERRRMQQAEKAQKRMQAHPSRVRPT